MRSLVDKYFKKKNKKKAIESKLEGKEEAPAAARRMLSLCSRGATTSASTPAGSYKHERPAPKTSAMATRASFARSAKSAIFPNTHFTNHESLPSLADASAAFAAAFPPYGDTQQADRIREDEYAHLEGHACLDYTGLGLFSHAQLHSCSNSSSFFNISYRPTSLASHVQYGADESGVESAMRRRIMGFLNVSEDDYSMVCTANRTAAFRLLAEAYPFRSSRRLLTVYDHESEAVSAMSECAARRGAKPASASFSWPSLRIQSAKLKAALMSGRGRRGLLVFPLQSRVTGTRHPYFWMRMAQENGWHVLLDACALGAKDLDALGLSLIRPDFLICSFFKLVGGDPSGFAGLFIKKSSSAVLEASAASVGIVSLVPARGADIDLSGTGSSVEWDSTSSAPVPTPVLLCGDDEQFKRFEHGETSEQHGPVAAEDGKRGEAEEIKCRGLDHADALGLVSISCRLRCLSNWLVIALAKLRHPSSENGHALVRIYGPRVRFDRGPALAFNVFDWKGEKVEPALVQKLADRSGISLGCGLLRNICFPEGYEEPRDAAIVVGQKESACSSSSSAGISVLNASLGFLSNFGDAYRLWSFVAKFLDADFVEKERWRYVALNQKMVEV
ncbi:putative molybdenum cofactor sulfurase 3 [Iris pallida]|uniref:Molybdenum cofactor sulfurase 3 n=1 Tax=Iris pallida TaxID=29817 RepID=A0AAX6GC02_IRIPA|nr:putative molybdenum cofactor sulfurase 3 [Iris pallida]